jgi:hypothetical protein
MLFIINNLVFSFNLLSFFFIWQKVEIEITNYYGMYGLYYHLGTMSTKELNLNSPLL